MSDFFIISKPAAIWTAENPVLPENYVGVETSLVNGSQVDTLKAKLFDGVHSWTQLSYWSPNAGAGGPASSVVGDIATWNSTTGALLADGGMTLPAASGIVGYLNIPQQTFSAAYPIVAADASKHLYHPATDASARQVTIPANASVAFPLGTAITIVNDSAGNVTVVVTSDTLAYVNVGTVTTVTIPQFNEVTILKVLSTRWICSGTAGVTTA